MHTNVSTYWALKAGEKGEGVRGKLFVAGFNCNKFGLQKSLLFNVYELSLHSLRLVLFLGFLMIIHAEGSRLQVKVVASPCILRRG